MSLMSLGWNERLFDIFEPYRERGLTPGRVVLTGGGLLRVAGDVDVLTAVQAGRLDDDGDPGPPAVGDWVAADAKVETAVVRVILPRSTVLARRRPGAAERRQVLAANVEKVLLVDGLDRGPNPRRIERSVALAYENGIEPVVVLSKADVCADVVAAVEKARGAAPFAEVVAVSATTGVGLVELEAVLAPGTTAVLLGPSGAGKSTLVNHLLGRERMRTGAVRRQDLRGRHTTSHRELVETASGACLIDSPGIRELGLWLDTGAVDAAFADVEAHAARCRFRDCRHDTEPGCAVQAAAAAGEIAADRLAAYRELRLEAEAHQRRRNAQAQRSHERRFARMVRQVKKLKG